MSEENRRPVKSRGQKAFQDLAAQLVKMGLTPNIVSVLSSVFALVAGFAFVQIGRAEGAEIWIFAALTLAGIQLRLICNLIDGLMAVEGGLKTPTGELYNEIPDRVSDTLILLGAAYSTGVYAVHILGWLSALLAMTTAYLRVLGAAVGTPHFFSGPMAKQHRMFTMNLTVIAAAIEQQTVGHIETTVAVGLLVVATGSLWTCLRRVYLVSQTLNKK